MSDVDDVLELWRRNEEASNVRDHEAQDAFLARDLVICSAATGGFVDGLTAIRAGEDQAAALFKSFTFTSDDLECRVHGDTAIVWGRFRYVLTPHDGEPVETGGRFSSTWARVGGEWRDVFNHYSA